MRSAEIGAGAALTAQGLMTTGRAVAQGIQDGRILMTQADPGRGIGSPVSEGTGNLLQASSKSEGLASVGNLPENIQSSVKSFFKGGSTKYTDFSVKQESNGNYVASMVKPGNVPGSKAIYYKVISPEGETISVYKDTFDHPGNLVHSKPKN